MLKKLHLQMTFFCTLITSLILISITGIFLYNTERNTKKASYDFNIHIRDNGQSLFYCDLNNTHFSDALTTQIYDIAKAEHSIDLENANRTNTLLSHAEFRMHGVDGVNYYVSVAILPKKGGYLSAIILSPLLDEHSNLLQQRLFFIALNLLAISILTVFSWFFTKQIIRPIAESRLRQTQFIASASHELRSPLTVMLSSLSAMRVASPEEAGDFANTIQSEGQRMSHLINDMLLLANADNSTWSIHPAWVELDTLLLQTYEKYTPLAAKKRLSFSVDLPDDAVPSCFCDSERIAQVLSILIDNAFSYTPTGGNVRLGIRLESAKTVLYVQDNGPGITDEDKPFIFERFYRADKAHNSSAHFGLGLCIAHEIIKLHKGKIVISDTAGGGATFSIHM